MQQKVTPTNWLLQSRRCNTGPHPARHVVPLGRGAKCEKQVNAHKHNMEKQHFGRQHTAHSTHVSISPFVTHPGQVHVARCADHARCHLERGVEDVIQRPLAVLRPRCGPRGCGGLVEVDNVRERVGVADGHGRGKENEKNNHGCILHLLATCGLNNNESCREIFSVDYFFFKWFISFESCTIFLYFSRTLLTKTV